MIELISRRSLTVALGALTLLTTPLRAQVLDPTFAHVDARSSDPLSNFWLVRALAAHDGAKILVGGYYDFINGAPAGGVSRLLPTSTPDATYNPGGQGANSMVDALEPLSDGRTLIGGSFSRYNGRAVGYVTRLNADGTPDPTFNPGGTGADGQVLDIQRDRQDRILLAGSFRHYNGQPVGEVTRLLPDGTLDPTFAAPMTNGGVAFSVATDAAGNVLVGGNSLGANYANLVRLLPTGAEDPTFNPGAAGPNTTVRRVRVLRTGQVLVGGGFDSYNGSPARGIVRLTTTGALDPGFTSPFEYGRINDLIMLSTGQVVVGGSNIRLPGQTSGKRVWRLQPNGTPDASFTAPDLDNQVYALLPADGGGLLIGGNFSTLNGQPALGVARLSATGTPDPTFASPTFQQYGEVSGLVLQTGDRLVAASNFGTINGQAVRSVVRFTPNGAPDPTFQLDPAVTTSPIYERPLVVEPGTDRILLTEYDHVQRLQPNGALDASFDDGAGADNQNSSFSSGLTRSVYQPDGKLLISGDFTRYNGVARTGLVRLTATGAVDPTFAPPVDSSYFVQDIQLLPNGSIAALYNDYNTQQLRWLDASGAPLAGFNGAAPLVGVLHILGLPDGTVLAGGAYTLGGILYQGTYKLTSTGTIDPSFGLDPSLRQSAITFTRQPDGKLLFRDGLTQGHRVRRLLPTGAVDAAFSPTEFGGGYIGDSEGPMVVQSTGKLVVGGGFNTVNGVLRPSLVRLLDIPTGLAADAPAARAFDVFPNPAHAALTLRRATAEGATATLVDVLGRPVRQWPLAAAAQQTVSLTGVPAGAYVVRIQGATGILTQRVVVE